MQPGTITGRWQASRRRCHSFASKFIESSCHTSSNGTFIAIICTARVGRLCEPGARVRPQGTCDHRRGWRASMSITATTTTTTLTHRHTSLFPYIISGSALPRCVGALQTFLFFSQTCSTPLLSCLFLRHITYYREDSMDIFIFIFCKRWQCVNWIQQ